MPALEGPDALLIDWGILVGECAKALPHFSI